MNLKKKKTFISKNFLNFFFIILIFFVFLKEFRVLQNLYYLVVNKHDQRATKAYKKTFFSGYCKGSSHGYLFYIKERFSNKFDENKIPKIINNFNGKKEYWIFQNVNAKISEEKIIILNNKKSINLNKYKIIDESGECFFIEEKK